MDTASVFLPPQQKKAGNSRLLIIHCCGVASAGVSYRLWIWEDIIQFQLRVIQKVWMMLNSLYGDVFFFVDMHWLVIIEIDEGSGMPDSENAVTEVGRLELRDLKKTSTSSFFLLV